MAIENVQDPEVKASPLAPFDPTQAAQGRVSPLTAAMLTPALGATLGWAEKLSPTLREYGQMANQSAPLNAAMGRFMGGTVPGVAAGAIPVPIGEGVLAPFAGLVRGAAQAAPLGLLGAAAQQPDLTHPDITALAKGTAATAAAGGTLGLFGDIGSTFYNPAVQRAKIAMETSTPGSRFTLAEGMKALEDKPVSDPVLQRLMAERGGAPLDVGGNLGVLGTKYLRQSQPAANQARAIIKQRLDAVTQAKNAIANDPTTGYDAILAQPVDNPAAQAIWTARGNSGTPTGRDLFSIYKKLRDRVQQQQNVIDRATGTVDREAMHNASIQAGQLRDILSEEVPGFNELQTNIQPYLDREEALRRLGVQLQGRGIYLKGRQPPPPPKSTTEKLKEAFGITSYFGSERAARSLVPILYGTTSPADMLAAIKAAEAAQTFGHLVPPFGAGATAGLLGMPQVRHRLGLLAP